MYIGRKILIVAIILLFTYIIYSLLQSRKAIINNLQQYTSEKEKRSEGFAGKDDPNYDAIMKEIKNISDKIIFQIDNNNRAVVYKNYNANIDNRLVKTVFTKASYNSAFTGNYLSNEMIKFSLSQGCRFLDFEIDISNIPLIVCKNSDGTHKTKSGSTSGISFNEALKSTLDAAFSENSGTTYPVTNTKDPLFIHVRCSNDEYNIVYDSVLKKLANDPHYKQFLLCDNDGKFNTIDLNSAKMSELKNKAIIIFCNIDNTSSLSNRFNYSYDIRNAKRYSSLTSTSEKPSNKFEIVLSDDTALDEMKANPDVFKSVKNYGYSVTCISYYNYFKQAYLTQNERKYENIFTDLNYSFIAMSDMKIYISSNPLDSSK